MADQSAGFTGSIPANYDSGLGPNLFVDFAADLVQRAAATCPSRVLEIAAGTGIVTRLLRDALPCTAHLVASDLNPPMLEIARRKFSADERVEFRPADAVALPFADGTFDAIICQFGAMFFSDKDKAHREAHRVLASGGRYHFNVWDSFEYNAFARISHETIGRFFNGDGPTFFTVPFGYYRIDEIKSSLLAAGFTEIAAHVLKIDKPVTEVRQFVTGLVLGNPIIEEIRVRGTINPGPIIEALTRALKGTFGEGPWRMPLQAIILSASRP